MIVRQRFRHQLRKIAAGQDRDGFIQPKRFVADNGLQLHCRHHVAHFFPGALGRDRDDDGFHPPKSEGQDDVIDAVRKKQSHARPWGHMGLCQERACFGDFLDKFRVGDAIALVDECRFGWPGAGCLVQQFGQVHSANTMLAPSIGKACPTGQWPAATSQ